MSEKDFLSQFSTENKPDSFKEEERVPVQKPNRPIPVKGIVIGAVALAAIAAVVYFLFFRPKIVMPNFVGQKESEVGIWVRQQQIDAQGIVMKGEYNFDYDEGIIIEQSVKEGTKVKNNVKVTFIVSKGADPDEKVRVPDIASMNRAEIDSWIRDNKMQKIRITTTYSEDVPEGSVISFDMKGTDPDEFTRGSAMNISISKGPQPAGTVTVPEFTSREQAETWAKTNKVKLEVVEAFNNDKMAGTVYDQNPKKDQTMKSTDTVTIYISKGKGITVPNLTTMTKVQSEEWLSKHPVNRKERYSSTTHHIVSQSIRAGTMVSESELAEMEVVVNLGSTFYAEDVGIVLVGGDYQRLVDKLNDIRGLGIDAFAANWTSGNEIYSEEFERGRIISAECTGYSNNQVYACEGPLPLDARFDVVISKGKVYSVSTEGTVSDLMSELSGKATFKLDSNIKTEYYSYYAKVVNADGSAVTDGKIYEDKEYKIVLTQAPPEPSPEPEPTPDTSVKLSKTKGTAQELEQELDSHGISYERNPDEVALTDSAKIVTSDDMDLEGMIAYTDQTYKIVPYK
ncbi:MAG: PASTA domain-containing protein [Erysipelotrichaceae bacterium]|nr:PASTA domain-containing protein [Erysipelotrichaceae bacterium]